MPRSAISGIGEAVCGSFPFLAAWLWSAVWSLVAAVPAAFWSLVEVEVEPAAAPVALWPVWLWSLALGFWAAAPLSVEPAGCEYDGWVEVPVAAPVLEGAALPVVSLEIAPEFVVPLCGVAD